MTKLLSRMSARVQRWRATRALRRWLRMQEQAGWPCLGEEER